MLFVILFCISMKMICCAYSCFKVSYYKCFWYVFNEFHNHMCRRLKKKKTKKNKSNKKKMNCKKTIQNLTQIYMNGCWRIGVPCTDSKMWKFIFVPLCLIFPTFWFNRDTNSSLEKPIKLNYRVIPFVLV